MIMVITFNFLFRYNNVSCCLLTTMISLALVFFDIIITMSDMSSDYSTCAGLPDAGDAEVATDMELYYFDRVLLPIRQLKYSLE